jgi:hypothetical protein
MTFRARPADRLDLCRKLLAAAMAAAFLLVVLMAADARFRDRDSETAALAAALGTTRLALAPSGHPLRDPILLDARVDLRFMPTLPRFLASPFVPDTDPLPPSLPGKGGRGVRLSSPWQK